MNENMTARERQAFMGGWLFGTIVTTVVILAVIGWLKMLGAI